MQKQIGGKNFNSLSEYLTSHLLLIFEKLIDPRREISLNKSFKSEKQRELSCVFLNIPALNIHEPEE